MFNKLRQLFSNIKHKPIFIVSIILVVIILICTLGLKYKSYVSRTLQKTHVYVSTDSEDNPDEFFKWIKEELEVSWVPTYIIIEDGYVISAFNGCIDVNTFEEKFIQAMVYGQPQYELPNIYITNLIGDKNNVHDLFSNGTYILELHWIDCKDCIYQDEHYTDSIYKKYTTSQFYRYYIKSDFNDVLAKYTK